MRDHYAVVADPVRDQEDYWRTQYGIHLVGYATADNGRDHSGLLALLTSLGSSEAEPQQHTRLDFGDPAAVLALARYAAGCLTPDASERFNILVRMANPDNGVGARPALHTNWPVERLLREGPPSFILLGEPGAGKSFAMREAVNLAASNLQDTCLRGELHAGGRIPIAIDLKLYDGDLAGMIAGEFPQGLSLDQLYAAFPITVYLDGYNEIPRAFLEDGSFNGQLNELLDAKPELGLVVCSRTRDGLEQLDLPTFRLSEVDVAEVNRRLLANGVTLPVVHRQEIVRILQRPFYFRLLDRAVMAPDQVHVPGDLYSQFIDNVAARATSFGPIDLVAALQRHAYAALENGSEAFAISDLESAIAAVAPQLGKAEIERVINWLASEEVIIPMRGGRAAFVHQSVTEYLAACELTTKLEQDAENVERLINLRRWDHVIFLALGMLDETLAAALLSEITERDVSFALNAARYVQHGGEALIGQLLGIVAELPSNAFDFDAKVAFSRLPFAPSHEDALRRILRVPVLRGEAFIALSKSLGAPVKQELIECLFTEDKTGPIREIGKALAYVLDPSDLAVLVERLACADIESLDEDGSVTHQQVSGVAAAARRLSSEDVRRETAGRLSTFSLDAQHIVAALIGEIFSERKSADGLTVVIHVARARLLPNLFAIYLMVRFEPDLRRQFADEIDDDLFDTIMHYVSSGDRWSFELLQACAADDTVLSRLVAEAEKSSGIRRDLLDYWATPDPAALLAALEKWWQERTPEDLNLLRAIDFADLDWGGHHDVLVSLLARHDLELVQLVLGESIPIRLSGLDDIDLGEPKPWVDWLHRLIGDEDGPVGRESQWVAWQIAHLIGRSSFAENKAQLLEMLDRGTDAQRWIVASRILPEIEDLSIADFSPGALDLLKSIVVLGHGGSEFRPHVFARLADETFLRNELFPLCQKSNQARAAVGKITRIASKRLGIRLNLPSAT